MMKRLLPLACLLACCHTWAADAPLKLDGDAKRAGYVAGYRFGASLQRDASDLDLEAVVRGLRDAANNKAPAIAEDQQQAAIDTWQTNRVQSMAATNAAAARKYLDANAKRSGVVTLHSGLQYEVIKSGQGPSPKVNDSVKVHYVGTLISGEVFDSSIQRGKPASFAVDQVIPGWTEALQLMKVGDKWKLFIPPELAYGNRAMGNKIKPGSALVFEVELLEVTPGAPTAP